MSKQLLRNRIYYIEIQSFFTDTTQLKYKHENIKGGHKM